MQITIEDLSPVEKRVEFELPWSDVVPKLEKAYDSLRRGVRLPGFRPGKVPRALLEKMYKRQVEDEVARDLVEHSIGQAIRENQLQPVAPPTVEDLEIKSGAPFKFTARVEVRSQVTPKDYSGVPLPRRPASVKDEAVTEALEGYRRRLTEFKPVEGRTETGDTDLAAGRGVRAGGRAQAEAPPGRGRSRERHRGRAPGPGEPAAREADRRRADRGRVHDVGRGTAPRAGRQGGAPPRDHQGAPREEGPGARRRDGQGHRRGRDARRTAREGARAAARAGRAPHQERDDARADQGAGEAQRVRDRARADRPLRRSCSSTAPSSS